MWFKWDWNFKNETEFAYFSFFAEVNSLCREKYVCFLSLHFKFDYFAITVGVEFEIETQRVSERKNNIIKNIIIKGIL